jgi:osmotically-inducible protein OsmY
MPIEQQIEQAILRSPYFDGRTLRFETCDGNVVLHGVVKTFFQKQIAQETVRQIHGVNRIENQLVVTHL